MLRSRFSLCFALLLSLLLLAGCQDQTPSAKTSDPAPSKQAGLVGQQAPDFTLPLVDGGTVKLSDLRGKAVMVNFWATWCPPCRAEMPSMERLYAQTKDDGFVILAINVEADGLQVLPDFLKDHPHTFPVAVDTEGEVQTTYGVFRFPESFLVDPKGVIVEHVVGGRDWSDHRMIEKIKALAAQAKG